jgi:hypothetical protein
MSTNFSDKKFDARCLDVNNVTFMGILINYSIIFCGKNVLVWLVSLHVVTVRNVAATLNEDLHYIFTDNILTKGYLF